MRVLLSLLMFGCAATPVPLDRVGHASRPYTGLPAYLQHPIGEHELTPVEQTEQVSELLGDIDARAAALDGSAPSQQQAELKDRVHTLGVVVPPTPDLLVPVDRLKLVVDDMPKNPPDTTRRRVWA